MLEIFAAEVYLSKGVFLGIRHWNHREAANNVVFSRAFGLSSFNLIVLSYLIYTARHSNHSNGEQYIEKQKTSKQKPTFMLGSHRRSRGLVSLSLMK